MWLCLVLALGLAGIKSVRSLWRKFHAQPPEPMIAATVVGMYEKDLTALLWLASLITGDNGSASDTVVESLCLDDADNPFFAHWMAVWSRKLVIAKSLGKIAPELKDSARRTALAPYPAGSANMPSPDWSREHPVNRIQLQRALSAIDVFPRCAVLLMIFERLSLEDTVVLLNADKELVTLARAIGLAELARNLASEQGWIAESRLPRQAVIEEMQPV